MQNELQEVFIKKWNKYFSGADLPFVFFYSDEEKYAEHTVKKKGWTCMIAPFSSGCGSIINYPLLENKREDLRSVIGMFDTSARPYVDEITLSFALPMGVFVKMVHEMDESFLITKDWERIGNRINKTGSNSNQMRADNG